MGRFSLLAFKDEAGAQHTVGLAYSMADLVPAIWHLLGPLRLLADSRDEEAARMLLAGWGASDELSSELSAACLQSKLSVWQQIPSWGRRGQRLAGGRPADWQLISRLLKNMDELQDILEDTPPKLPTPAAATKLLGTLLRLCMRHVKSRLSDRGRDEAAEVLSSRIPAVASMAPFASHFCLQEWLTHITVHGAQKLSASPERAPAAPVALDARLLVGGEATVAAALGDAVSELGHGGPASEPRLAPGDEVPKPAENTASLRGEAPPRVGYAPFASPRTLRLLSAGALQGSPPTPTDLAQSLCEPGGGGAGQAGQRCAGAKDTPQGRGANNLAGPAVMAVGCEGAAQAARSKGKGNGDTPPAKKKGRARAGKKNGADLNQSSMLRFLSAAKPAVAVRKPVNSESG